MGFITDKQFKLFAVGNELKINANNFQSSVLCSANTKKFKYSISPFHSQDLKINSPNQNHTFVLIGPEKFGVISSPPY